MEEDPVVAEVRRSRVRHARAFKFDLQASGHPVVALNSKHRLVRTGS